MFEVVSAFQSKTNLQGNDRIRLLEVLVGAGIAYTAPCAHGDALAFESTYAKIVRDKAVEIASAVNEQILLNIDSVLTYSNELWVARYAALNCPLIGCHTPERVAKSLSDGVTNLTDEYNRWVESFVTEFRACWTA